MQCCLRVYGMLIAAQPLAEVEAEVSPSGARGPRSASACHERDDGGSGPRQARARLGRSPHPWRASSPWPCRRSRPPSCGRAGVRRRVPSLRAPTWRLGPRSGIRGGEGQVAEAHGSGVGEPGGAPYSIRASRKATMAAWDDRAGHSRYRSRGTPPESQRVCAPVRARVDELASASIWWTPPAPSAERRFASADRSEVAPSADGTSRSPLSAARRIARPSLLRRGPCRSMRRRSPAGDRRRFRRPCSRDPQPHRLDVAATQNPTAEPGAILPGPPEVTALVGTTERLFGIGAVVLVPFRGARQVNGGELG